MNNDPDENEEAGEEKPILYFFEEQVNPRIPNAYLAPPDDPDCTIRPGTLR